MRILSRMKVVGKLDNVRFFFLSLRQHGFTAINRKNGHLTSSKVMLCNGYMRRHPSKCAISSNRANTRI